MAGNLWVMSIEQLESKLMELPPKERRRFARWFYDHENEILEPGDDETAPEVYAEVIRRREELRAQPGLAVPVTDEWFEQLKAKVRNARAAQASAR
jgi:hypothetical protein